MKDRVKRDEKTGITFHDSKERIRKFKPELIEKTPNFLRYGMGKRSIFVRDHFGNELNLKIHRHFEVFYNTGSCLVFNSPVDLKIIGRISDCLPIMLVDIETILTVEDYIKDNKINAKPLDLVDHSKITEECKLWLESGYLYDYNREIWDYMKKIETISEDEKWKMMGIPDDIREQCRPLSDFHKNTKEISLEQILNKVEDTEESDLDDKIEQDNKRLESIDPIDKIQSINLRKKLSENVKKQIININKTEGDLKNIYKNNALTGRLYEDDEDLYIKVGMEDFLEQMVEKDMMSTFGFFKKATPKQKMFIKQGDVEKQLKRIFFDVNESNPEKLL